MQKLDEEADGQRDDDDKGVERVPLVAEVGPAERKNLQNHLNRHDAQESEVAQINNVL